MFAKLINDIKVIFYNKYAQCLMALFSIVFGLVKSLSEFVYNNNEVNIDIMRSGIYALGCYLLLNFAYYVITREYKIKPIEIKSPRKLWWTFFAIFLLSYCICWLTYWPGNVYIDNWWIARSGSSLNIARQHPIIYCAFIAFLVKIGTWLGSINYSIILYTGLQISVVSIFMASLFFFIFQRKIPKILKFLLFLSCVLLPIYAVYAISNVKDVYWSVCMAGFIILLYRLCISQKHSRNFWILFNTYLLGILLLRNNGIYIVLPTLVCLLCLLAKQRKQLLLSVGLVFISIFLISGWMKLLNIRPLFQEKVGVPIQQIAAVVKNEGNITAEQRQFISKIISIDTIKNRYNPYCVDTIKWGNSEFDSRFLDENSSRFMKIWKDIITQNVDISILAYFQAIYSYWAPNEIGKINLILEKIPNEKYSLFPWIVDNNYIKQEIMPTGIKMHLTKYYEYAYKYWHEGSLFWILAGCALLYYLRRRNLRDLIIYLPIFLLWGTLMLAAPVHDFRYILSYIYILPLYIALLFINPKEEDIDKEYKLIDYKNWSNETKNIIKISVKFFIALVAILYAIWYFTIGYPITSRVDLSIPYTENHSFIVLKHDKALSEAEWMPKFGKRGIVIQQKDDKYSCVVIPVEDTDITISLRGPDERDASGNRYEKWVKYTDFRINGEKILSEPVDTWHDKPFNYVLKAEKGKLYKIQYKWRKK